MKDKINRRTFVKQGLTIGSGFFVGSTSPLLGSLLPPKVDLSVVSGTDYFTTTQRALDALGGMKSFVRNGSTVGLLINSPFDRVGTYTNPDIALAVLKMCIEAGAKEIYSLEDASMNYWKRSRLFSLFEKELARVQHDGTKTTVKIAKGKSLTEADISKRLIDCDVFINLPIVKNHEGTRFTGCLKNIMGATSSSTNRFFHQGSGKGGVLKYFQFYNDIEFLSQCISDVHLIRKPDLCVMDATVFVTTNGPSGPGELKKTQKIIAGNNCVSVDAYGATLLGFQPEDILMIQYASEHGLGSYRINNLSIKEQ